MNRKQIITIFILFVTISTTIAQDSTKIRGCDSVITHNKNYYFMAGKRITSEQAFNRFSLFKKSGYEYKLYKKNYNLSLALIYTSGVFLLADGILNVTKQPPQLQSTFYVVFLSVGLTSFIPLKLSHKHLEKSNTLYNNEICHY